MDVLILSGLFLDVGVVVREIKYLILVNFFMIKDVYCKFLFYQMDWFDLKFYFYQVGYLFYQF